MRRAAGGGIHANCATLARGGRGLGGVAGRVHGVGSYQYKETSTFNDPSEDVDVRHAGVVVNGGAEFRVHRWVGIGAEVEYSHVPGILGNGGVSQQAGEKDLGGVAGRLKLIVGR